MKASVGLQRTAATHRTRIETETTGACHLEGGAMNRTLPGIHHAAEKEYGVGACWFGAWAASNRKSR
jgi:hypothetical protein